MASRSTVVKPGLDGNLIGAGRHVQKAELTVRRGCKRQGRVSSTGRDGRQNHTALFVLTVPVMLPCTCATAGSAVKSISASAKLKRFITEDSFKRIG
jgi:hypothetical protein